MTDKEFFVQTVADELPRFQRVYKAIPKKGTTWRPHKNSRTAKDLAVTMAVECATFPVFFKTGEVDFSTIYKKAPKDISGALKMLTSSMKKGHEIAKKMTQAQWASKAQMKSGDKVEWETTKGNMAWGLILDLIHHRGQLSAYLRPMGAKVPSIYGPSGDSQ